MFKELDSFIEYVTHEKRYSKHTVTSYKNDINQMLCFARSQYEIKQIDRITHQVIRSWIVEQMDLGKTPKSLNRKISSLRSFFNFLRKIGKCDKNPMLKIIAPKIPKRLPSVIREEQLNKIFKNKNSQAEFPESRDQLIVELLYCTGMRRDELIKLRDEDVDFSSSYITVTGKGNKQRNIPISIALLKLIKEYIEKRKEFFESLNSSNLFVTNKNQKLYPKFLYNLVKQVLSEVSTATKRSPHILRHSFATHLTNNGADINAIKSLLGHANLGATQIYTQNSIEKLKKVYEKSHPKASKAD